MAGSISSAGRRRTAGISDPIRTTSARDMVGMGLAALAILARPVRPDRDLALLTGTMTPIRCFETPCAHRQEWAGQSTDSGLGEPFQCLDGGALLEAGADLSWLYRQFASAHVPVLPSA